MEIETTKFRLLKAKYCECSENHFGTWNFDFWTTFFLIENTKFWRVKRVFTMKLQKRFSDSEHLIKSFKRIYILTHQKLNIAISENYKGKIIRKSESSICECRIMWVIGNFDFRTKFFRTEYTKFWRLKRVFVCYNEIWSENFRIAKI